MDLVDMAVGLAAPADTEAPVGLADTEARVAVGRRWVAECTGVLPWGIVPLPRDRPWAAECGTPHPETEAAAAASSPPSA